jgi:hypothetical protein
VRAWAFIVALVLVIILCVLKPFHGQCTGHALAVPRRGAGLARHVAVLALQARFVNREHSILSTQRPACLAKDRFFPGGILLLQSVKPIFAAQAVTWVWPLAFQAAHIACFASDFVSKPRNFPSVALKDRTVDKPKYWTHTSSTLQIEICPAIITIILRRPKAILTV